MCHDVSEHDKEDEEDNEKGPCSLGAKAESRFGFIGFSRGFGPSVIKMFSTG